jgi:hypothetical protein
VPLTEAALHHFPYCDIFMLHQYQMLMAANTEIADVMHLVAVLADCSKICRNLTASTAFDIARDHSLPDLPQLSRLVNDCAASCDIAILLIERKSHIVIDFLEVCEELAMDCAWECSKYGFEPCKQCSEACELVAKACLPYIISEQAI